MEAQVGSQPNWQRGRRALSSESKGTPPNATTPQEVRPYQTINGLVPAPSNPSIRPYFLAGMALGGLPLDCHDLSAPDQSSGSQNGWHVPTVRQTECPSQ